ncbi:nucleotidyltransferase family protein [Paroceanicella profunda]|uniref:Nucleotidyltransferase family protein n=1 Tax=Paroceanicella profunda TaxID=2579971 RepID=A0A5B8FTS7_9RHOB|nr:nucleotidyltransferase family protein [Paroceanicella profunda]QDL91775.1 nucleotidyltransferase family protein [Paroceanicella profunda]
MAEPVMIFAAGFGTRMGALTAHCPKPLLRVAGRSLLDRVLDRAEAAGCPRAVVNLHYRSAQIRDHLATRRRPEIAFSDEQPEILDTGGGLRAALPLLGAGEGPVLTLNSDAIWTGEDPVATLRAAWAPGMGALLHLVPRAAATGYTRAGDFFLEPDGRLRRRGSAETAPFVFTGAQLLRIGPLAALPAGAFSLNLLWDRLLEEGLLYGAPGGGGWIDVGTPEGLALADRALGGT